MIPIKLMPDNEALLAFIEEEATLDHEDFLEREVIHGSEDATKLLAIENATEIAKRFIQRHYKDILRAICSESPNKERTVYRCKNLDNLNRTDMALEYLHLEKNLETGGHGVYLRVDNMKKRIHVWDSMGENAYMNEFEDTVREVYPGYRVYDKSIGFQPTGGFVQATPEDFGQALYISGEPGYLNRAWKVSQYDELSQHHFCYVEAFVAMAFDSLPMRRVGPEDPRDRLRFIKKVVWGFVHRFYTGSRESAAWKYFEEHFPYYMTTWNSDGTRMNLRNDTFQVPKKDTFVTRIEQIETVDTSGWTVKDILKWAAKS